MAGATSREGHIGRYRLMGLLATGGMAEVYLALSGELSGFRTLVVVKRILPHLASNQDFIHMFFDEARIVALLDHPNIVRIIEVGQDDDEYFLAMEVVQGKPLSALLRKAAKREKPLTHAQSAFIVAQAANGLGYAHNLAGADGQLLNVVHRDVSPQNILVSFEGAVKVIDFGVARALGRLTETSPGGLKGKISYMSPEHASSGRVDRRSDVFALGVVLWEAVCGQRLFRKDSELATLRAIVDDPITAPSKVVRISPRLERIIMRALEKDPADRFQNALEMALELERHAFASEGFSPQQIGGAMKDLFASDFGRWKKTVSAAMDLEGDAAHWSNTSGTFIRPQEVELHTRGTVALHPVALTPVVPLGQTQELPSDSRSAHSLEFSLPAAPARRERRWFVGGLAMLVMAVALAIFVLSRPANTVTMVRPASGGGFQMSVQPLAPLAAPVVPAVRRADPVERRPTAPPGGGAEAPVFGPQPAPPAKSGTSAPIDVFAENFAPSGPSVTSVDKTGAGTKNLSRRSAHAPAAKAITKPAVRSGKAAHAAGPAPVATAAAATDTCSIAVGTNPWSEVWIDGKNTHRHTPYTEAIGCGKHKVTFKRPDLNVAETINIALAPGEKFKQILSLDGE